MSVAPGVRLGVYEVRDPSGASHTNIASIFGSEDGVGRS